MFFKNNDFFTNRVLPDIDAMNRMAEEMKKMETRILKPGQVYNFNFDKSSKDESDETFGLLHDDIPAVKGVEAIISKQYDNFDCCCKIPDSRSDNMKKMHIKDRTRIRQMKKDGGLSHVVANVSQIRESNGELAYIGRVDVADAGTGVTNNVLTTGKTKNVLGVRYDVYHTLMHLAHPYIPSDLGNFITKISECIKRRWEGTVTVTEVDISEEYCRSILAVKPYSGKMSQLVFKYLDKNYYSFSRLLGKHGVLECMHKMNIEFGGYASMDIVNEVLITFSRGVKIDQGFVHHGSRAATITYDTDTDYQQMLFRVGAMVGMSRMTTLKFLKDNLKKEAFNNCYGNYPFIIEGYDIRNFLIGINNVQLIRSRCKDSVDIFNLLARGFGRNFARKLCTLAYPKHAKLFLLEDKKKSLILNIDMNNLLLLIPRIISAFNESHTLTISDLVVKTYVKDELSATVRLEILRSDIMSCIISSGDRYLSDATPDFVYRLHLPRSKAAVEELCWWLVDIEYTLEQLINLLKICGIQYDYVKYVISGSIRVGQKGHRFFIKGDFVGYHDISDDDEMNMFVTDTVFLCSLAMESDENISENPVPMEIDNVNGSEEVIIDLTNSNDISDSQVQFPNLFEHFIASAVEEGRRQDMKRRRK